MAKASTVNEFHILVPKYLRHCPINFKNMHCSSYYLKNKNMVQMENKNHYDALYAPLPLSFYFLSLNQKPASFKIISNKTYRNHLAYYIYLRLRLKNERRLMGSDVPSPFMTKLLYHHVNIADGISFTIGDWLALTVNFYKNIRLQRNSIFFLEKNEENDQLIKFLHS